MPSSLTPARRRGVEILDDPQVSDNVRLPAMADVARANRLFGGTRAVIAALGDALPALPRYTTMVDVGTGSGDIAAAARHACARGGITLDAFGVDVAEALVASARHRLAGAVVANGVRLPFADASADVVMCSQVLHHFADDEAGALIRELHRVSRDWIIIADLRRSWLAAAGFYVASRVLHFHPVTRVDGVASVFRGFLPAELELLIRKQTGVTPRLRSRAFWRITAAWRKG